MKKLKIILIFSFITTHTFAINYYVDSTNGNDNYRGTTPENAWQSIAKVNCAYFLPGDSILFKRGEIFRGNLIPKSGSELGSITYSDYGTGIKPKILGSIQKNRFSDWVNEGSNIWSTSKQTVNSVGSEILSNPDFDSDATGWYEWYNISNDASSALSRTTVEGEYYISPGGGKFECIRSGKVPSDIQLWTSKYPITFNKWYRFIFKAKATQPFKIPSGKISIFQNASYSASTSKPLYINTSWITQEVYFKASVTATDARINFYFGGIIPDNTIFYFDSLSFKEIDGDPGLISLDVGNIIFNDDSCGVKVRYEKDLNAQGKFWFDRNNFILKMFSVSNPSSFYENMEIALCRENINIGNKSFITFQNLDLRYGASCGIDCANTHHIWIKDLDFSWIGGGYQPDLEEWGVRYGNGVQFWVAAHDNIVERCTFNQIYDAALTAQGDGSPYEAYNIYFRNNIIINSEYSYELWGRPAATNLHDIYFENNTCLYAGYGWGHTQRPDPNGAHLMLWSNSTVQMRNIFIRNNIFYESSNYGSRYNDMASVRKVIVDNNCWYESIGTIAFIGATDTYFDYISQLVAYKGISKQDEHSVFCDPLLTIDYSLDKNSPCIDAGISTFFVEEDYNRTQRPQGKKPDIGAFEFIELTSLDIYNYNNGMIVFPNPAFNKITIETEEIKSPGMISIINISGRELVKHKVESNKHTVDISGIPPGIYFVELHSDKSKKVKRFVKKAPEY